MKIIPKIGFCVVLSLFEENADQAQDIFENALNRLKSDKKYEIVIANEFVKDASTAISVGKLFKKEEVDVICVKLATWSSDNLVLDMNSECGVPFIFWAYPHLSAGSLCGAQQFNMVFKELNKNCIFVYKDDEQALEKIEVYSKSVALINKLKKARFGIIGSRTQGMAEVACDEFSVKEVIGSRIYSIGLDEFKAIAREFKDINVRSDWQEIKQKVGKTSVSESDGFNALKNYRALKKLVDSECLEGITIECYPRYMGEVCLGFSILADEGIPGACEGDVNSLILMYILMRLSGQPVHDIDPLYLFDENNSLVGCHCGCGSFDLAVSKQSIELTNVRLANRGLCVLFPSKSGKVTMANLVGRKGTYRMGVIEGEAIETEMIFPGNPIRIKLPVKISEFLDIVEECALGHHWIVAYGSYDKYLRHLASLMGIDYVKF
jgi:L-fucose isomerase-like protein